MPNTDTYWDTIDFRPAPNGWQLAYLTNNPEQPLTLEPLPGWLIQENVTFDIRTMEDLPTAGRRERRIIAAMVVPGEELYPADDHSDFWMELGPGQTPSWDDVREAVKERHGLTLPEVNL